MRFDIWVGEPYNFALGYQGIWQRGKQERGWEEKQREAKRGKERGGAKTWILATNIQAIISGAQLYYYYYYLLVRRTALWGFA